MADKSKSVQQIKQFYQERDAQKVLAGRHSEQVGQVASLESTIVTLAQALMKHLDERSEKVVDAVKGERAAIEPIANGIDSLLKSVVADRERKPQIELHFDQGVSPTGDFKDGKQYRVGQAVIFDGAVYVATVDTKQKPSTKDWQLFVPRGDQGIQGVPGAVGAIGPAGKDGKPGRDGLRGPQGDKGEPGPHGLMGLQGPKGDRGEKGERGERGPKGEKGAQGLTGVGFRGMPGVGVPEGGTTGQVLKKSSNENYETEWGNAGAGSGVVETIVAGNNIDVDSTDPANPIVSVETLSLSDISDVTASSSEVNILDGATLSTTELNYVDGVTSAIQTQLDNKYAPGGTDVALADGGTGASLVDPNADRVLFWDDSAGQVTWLTMGMNLSITGTTLDASGSGSAALDDLTDVVISSPATDDVLTYDGASWINAPQTGGGVSEADVVAFAVAL